MKLGFAQAEVCESIEDHELLSCASHIEDSITKLGEELDETKKKRIMEVLVWSANQSSPVGNNHPGLTLNQTRQVLSSQDLADCRIPFEYNHRKLRGARLIS